MNLRILYIAAVGAMLGGCTLEFEATFEGLSLMREEPADILAQSPPSGIEQIDFQLIGMLRLDIATDIDLIALMEDDGYHTGFDVETCKSQIVVRRWPIIYQNNRVSSDTQEKLYHYSVLVNPSSQNEYDFNDNAESLCVRLRAGKMVTLFYYSSNTVVIGRDKVIAALKGDK